MEQLGIRPVYIFRTGIFIFTFSLFSYFLGKQEITPFFLVVDLIEKFATAFWAGVGASIGATCIFVINKMKDNNEPLIKNSAFVLVFTAFFCGFLSVVFDFFGVQNATRGVRVGSFFAEPIQLQRGEQWDLDTSVRGKIEKDQDSLIVVADQLNARVVNTSNIWTHTSHSKITLKMELVSIHYIEFNICYRSGNSYTRIAEDSRGSNVLILRKDVKMGDILNFEGKKFIIKPKNNLDPSKNWLCIFIFQNSNNVETKIPAILLKNKDAKNEIENLGIPITSRGYYPIHSKHFLDGTKNSAVFN